MHNCFKMKSAMNAEAIRDRVVVKLCRALSQKICWNITKPLSGSIVAIITAFETSMLQDG